MKVIGPLLAIPLVLVMALTLLFGGPAEQGAAVGLAAHEDIPPVVMAAYLAAADTIGQEDPSCRPTWALLAGIGKVETDHGRYQGRTITASGVVQPPILGIVLDGSIPGTRAVADTDGGRLDGNSTWDRAVGPMQFIPGTWAAHARDADGDGVADPQHVGDAALTAAAYLCAAARRRGADVSTDPGRRIVVAAYNASAAYVRDVLAWMQRYLTEATHVTSLSGSGPIACPVVAPVQFIDSWHFPRSGGRVHLGQDLFAVRGQPLVAVDDGEVVEIRRGSGLGGDIIWLRTDVGHHWYYAHLSAFAPGLAAGDRVARGQVIGAVGTTGNAATTPPHLHIQWRPDGRRAADVNPYPLLSAACPGHD